jgi:hypothetical protein
VDGTITMSKYGEKLINFSLQSARSYLAVFYSQKAEVLVVYAQAIHHQLFLC